MTAEPTPLRRTHRNGHGDPYRNCAVALLESGLEALTAAYASLGPRHFDQVCRMRAAGLSWGDIAGRLGLVPLGADRR